MGMVAPTAGHQLQGTSSRSLPTCRRRSVAHSPFSLETAVSLRRASPMVSLTTTGSVVHRPACRQAGATASKGGGSARPPARDPPAYAGRHTPGAHHSDRGDHGRCSGAFTWLRECLTTSRCPAAHRRRWARGVINSHVAALGRRQCWTEAVRGHPPGGLRTVNLSPLQSTSRHPKASW